MEYVVEAIRPDKTLTTQGQADLARAYFNLGISLSGRPLEVKIAFDEARRLDFNYDKLCAEHQKIRNGAVPTQPPTGTPSCRCRSLRFKRFIR